MIGEPLEPRIAQLQRDLLRTVGATGEPAGAGGYIRVARTALEAVSVIGRRYRDDLPLTGWQIDAAHSAQPDHGVHGQFQLRELIADKPAWVVAAALPVGWSFLCVGNTIVEAVSPDGTTHEPMLSVDV